MVMIGKGEKRADVECVGEGVGGYIIVAKCEGDDSHEASGRTAGVLQQPSSRGE